MIDELIERIASNKAELDRLRPLSSRALAHLEHAQDLELTYTSNAIEGNALTRIETQLVTEQGITIAGKRLKDHLEAIDHYDAVRYVREFARRDSRLGECEARNLHALALKRAAPEIAGRYATAGRHVDSGAGRREFPAPADVPGLMGEFSAWLSAAAPTPETAFAAHRRLIDIHPFHDGNGRVARLLMNLILIRGGYPPIAVRPEDRLAYVESLQKARSGQGAEAFRQLLYQRLDATLREHLSALRDAALPTPVASLVQSE